MAQKNSNDSNFLLRIFVGFLFVVIGIQGMCGPDNYVKFGSMFGASALWGVMGNSVASIIVGIFIFLCGALVIIPIFFAKIPKGFSTGALIAIFIIWIFVIVVADFWNVSDRVKDMQWFAWTEQFIYHLLVLSCVYKVSSDAILSVMKKVKK